MLKLHVASVLVSVTLTFEPVPKNKPLLGYRACSPSFSRNPSIIQPKKNKQLAKVEGDFPSWDVIPDFVARHTNHASWRNNLWLLKINYHWDTV